MKLLITLIIFGLIVAGVWFGYTKLAAPEARACAKLGELCSSEAKDLDKCKQALAKLEEIGGEKAKTRAVDCIAKVESCAAATGCLVGAGFGAMGDFFKGITDAL